MIFIKCNYCGKTIKLPPSRVKKHNFCSTKCYHFFCRKTDKIFTEKEYAYILIKGQKIIFDIEDIEKIKKYKWHLHYNKKRNRYDVCSNTLGSHKDRKYIALSRFLMNCPKNMQIDHINHNTLDNRKCNLRICTNFENQLNKTNNTSGYVGVTWDKSRNKWYVFCKRKYIGRFNNIEDAIIARKNYLFHLGCNF